MHRRVKITLLNVPTPEQEKKNSSNHINSTNNDINRIPIVVTNSSIALFISMTLGYFLKILLADIYAIRLKEELKTTSYTQKYYYTLFIILYILGQIHVSMSRRFILSQARIFYVHKHNLFIIQILWSNIQRY